MKCQERWADVLFLGNRTAAVAIDKIEYFPKLEFLLGGEQHAADHVAIAGCHCYYSIIRAGPSKRHPRQCMKCRFYCIFFSDLAFFENASYRAPPSGATAQCQKGHLTMVPFLSPLKRY